MNDLARPSAAHIENILKNLIGSALDIPPGEIDAGAPFARFGIDSAVQVAILAALESQLGLELSPTLMLEFDSIREVSAHLEGQMRKVA